MLASKTPHAATPTGTANQNNWLPTTTKASIDANGTASTTTTVAGGTSAALPDRKWSKLMTKREEYEQGY